MAVVINDFEVVPETEPSPARSDTAGPPPAEKQEPERALLHLLERSERVRAH